MRMLKDPNGTITRRALLQALGIAAVGAPISTLAQGRCMRTFGSPACDTTPIPAVFPATGWKTVALDHLLFHVADRQKEAAFYAAVMGWTLRNDDGKQAVMDVGNWGTVIFRDAPADSFPAPAAGGRGNREPVRAIVKSFAFAIAPWNAKTIETELKKRGLTATADNDGRGFESFHIVDPDGFDLQICNANGWVKTRKTPGMAKPPQMPFEPTGWKTVWLDHLSFGVSNYKASTSFYTNLLGWKESYDEGSQNECLMGDVGDIIIRGGNPLAPPGAAPVRESRGIDHISWGIQPWDTDGVKAELEKRGLRAQVDTSTGDEIHVAAFKSYHTFTPNGYNLQISYVTKANRLALPNAVRPKPSAAK